ncbi:oxidoreductase [Streptomyces sp. CB01201]|nr:oxidoreductase [Streptomyces sp. CB01201]
MIPLRPLSVGDMLSGSFNTLGRHWKQIFGMALVAYGLAALLFGGAIAIAVSVVYDHFDPVFHHDYGVEPARSDVAPLVIAGAVLFVVSMTLWVLSLALMYAAVPAVLQDAVLGRRSSFGAVWRRAWSRFPAVLGTLMIQMAAMLVASFLLAALVVTTVLASSGSGHRAPPVALVVLFIVGFFGLVPVGIWLWVRFAFAPAAAVLENQGPVEALRRSARLVANAWWRTFGILMLIGMISGAIGYFVQLALGYGGIFAAMPLAMADDSDGAKVAAVVVMVVLYLIGTVISQFLSATLPQLGAGLLYIDQRIRRENLAPSLVEAAGVPPVPTGPADTRW